MRFLRNEHHLAAKNGTFLPAKMRGRLYYEWSFEVAVFLNIFCNNCYHQIEMISFIKLFPVIRFFLLQLMLGKVSSFCCLINMMLNFNVYNWFCVDMCWGVFLGRRRVVYPFPAFPFFVAVLNIICQDALLLRAIWWQNLEPGLLLPMCISSLLGVCDSHLGGGKGGGGEGGSSWGLFVFLIHVKKWRHKISFSLWFEWIARCWPFCVMIFVVSAIFIACWWYSFTKF